ncbi:DUF5011 domain-containing protein, partial [Muricauda sp. 334s03]
YHGATFTTGTYLITGVPYSAPGLGGDQGTTLSLSFSIVDDPGPDTTPPSIVLIGDNPQDIVLGGTYTELGATASDNNDGDISGSITIDASGVDTNSVGSYLVTYNVSDLAGNPATEAVRTVNVVDVPQVLSVTSFNLIDADSDNIIQVLSDGDVINMAALASSNLDIQAITTNDVGSVRLELSGTMAATRTESYAPYALFGDVSGNYHGATFTTGTYLITGVPYSAPGLGGDQGTTLSLSFSIVDDPGPDTTPPSIVLIGDNPQDIVLGGTYTELGATASDNNDGDISGSITIDASGVDTNSVGSYLVTYNVSDLAGNPATEAVRTVNVVDVPQVLSVTSFNLIDAESDIIIQQLSDGDVLDLNSLPTNNFDIQAITTNDVGSVRLELSGTMVATRTESYAPYALFGDVSGNYHGATFTTGTYLITGVPYSAPGLGGDQGTTLSLSFSIVDNDLTAKTTNNMSLYPNPANEVVSLNFETAKTVIQFEIFDFSGRLIKRKKATVYGDDYQIPVFDLPVGVYIVRILDEDGYSFQKQMVIER